MKSLAQKIEQCHGLCGTKDVSAWENEFLNDIFYKMKRNQNTTGFMTDKQIGVLEKLYAKHFAD